MDSINGTDINIRRNGKEEGEEKEGKKQERKHHQQILCKPRSIFVEHNDPIFYLNGLFFVLVSNKQHDNFVINSSQKGKPEGGKKGGRKKKSRETN